MTIVSLTYSAILVEIGEAHQTVDEGIHLIQVNDRLEWNVVTEEHRRSLDGPALAVAMPCR